jgi:hypothetical protein
MELTSHTCGAYKRWLEGLDVKIEHRAFCRGEGSARSVRPWTWCSSLRVTYDDRCAYVPGPLRRII